jgi:hypothetical protein
MRWITLIIVPHGRRSVTRSLLLLLFNHVLFWKTTCVYSQVDESDCVRIGSVDDYEEPRWHTYYRHVFGLDDDLFAITILFVIIIIVVLLLLLLLYFGRTCSRHVIHSLMERNDTHYTPHCRSRSIVYAGSSLDDIFLLYQVNVSITNRLQLFGPLGFFLLIFFLNNSCQKVTCRRVRRFASRYHNNCICSHWIIFYIILLFIYTDQNSGQ